MAMDLEELKTAIAAAWAHEFDDKAAAKIRRYVGKFFERTRIGERIAAQVVGNHGTYTVSIEMKDGRSISACSCYVGKGGFCHHCYALARTFLKDAESFKAIEKKKLGSVRTLEDVADYLSGTTLDELLRELKSHGISGKDFAESTGMSPRQLSLVKSGEARNRRYHELGMVKLACLWMMEHIKIKEEKKTGKAKR